MKGMLRVPEAARRYCLHDDTIRRAIRRGELPAVRAFNRTWVREEDLEALLTPSFSPGSDRSAPAQIDPEMSSIRSFQAESRSDGREGSTRKSKRDPTDLRLAGTLREQPDERTSPHELGPRTKQDGRRWKATRRVMTQTRRILPMRAPPKRILLGPSLTSPFSTKHVQAPLRLCHRDPASAVSAGPHGLVWIERPSR